MTHNQQEPFVYGSLGGTNVSLVPALKDSPANTPAPEDARADYELIERINTKAAWELFIEKHRTGYYAELARERLRLLEEARLAADRKAQKEALAEAAEGEAKRAAEKKGQEEQLRQKPGTKAATDATAKKRVEQKSVADARTTAPKDNDERARGQIDGRRQSDAATSRPARPSSTEDRGRKVEMFRDCEICPEMVVVPSGRFVMGSSDDDAAQDERPSHTVVIANGFAVGRTEVKVSEFVAFLNSSVQEKQFSERWIMADPEDTESPIARKTDNGNMRFLAKPDHDEDPITFVSWYGADAYVSWLSKRAGVAYRLLSEAEWEYSARAGSTAAYHFGDDARQLCNYANVVDLTSQKKYNWSLSTNCDDGYADLAPVGRFKPNTFGLHDMHGNAAEWVADCWHPNYDGAPIDGSPWIENGDCNSRIVRGGSYHNLPDGLRSAQRYVNAVYTKINTIGFRVARSLRP
jgi:formylglycine-generating enzyme required for sulfatase activity